MLCGVLRTLDDGHDGALLDSRRALETVGVDTTEKLGLQLHRIEGVGGLIVVGLDLSCTRNFVSTRVACCAGRLPVALSYRSACANRDRNGERTLDSPASMSSSPLSAMIAVLV